MTQEQYDSGKENIVETTAKTVNNGIPSGNGGVVFNTDYSSNDLLESKKSSPWNESPSAKESSTLANEIAKSRQLHEEQILAQTTAQISENSEYDIYDGYYSDNQNVGVTNTLEEEKKQYDLNSKKKDIISVKLG